MVHTPHSGSCLECGVWVVGHAPGHLGACVCVKVRGFLTAWVPGRHPRFNQCSGWAPVPSEGLWRSCAARRPRRNTGRVCWSQGRALPLVGTPRRAGLIAGTCCSGIRSCIQGLCHKTHGVRLVWHEHGPCSYQVEAAPGSLAFARCPCGLLTVHGVLGWCVCRMGCFPP